MGQVLDEQGHGIPSATVSVAPGDIRWRSREQAALRTSTAEDGTFALDVTGHEASDVVVSAAGYVAVSERAAALLELAERPVRILLRAGIKIRGVVTDPWSQPVAAAEVTALGRFGSDLWLGAGAVPGASTANDLKQTQTNASGEFEISGIPALPMILRVRKAGYVEYHRGHPTVVESESLPVTLVLHPLLRVGVRVVDDATGSVLPSARVDLTVARGLDFSGFDTRTRPASAHRTGWAREVPGEWWFTLRVADASLDRNQSEARAWASVQAHGFRTLTDKPVSLSSSDDGSDPQPTTFRLQRAVPESEFGQLQVAVHAALKGFRPSWVYLSVQRISETSQDAAVVLPTSLDSDGQGTLSLPAGTYTVGLGPGSGWFWLRSAEPFHRVEIRPGGVSQLKMSLTAARLRLRVAEGSTALRAYRVIVFKDPASRKSGAMRTTLGMIDKESAEEGEIFEPYREFLDLRGDQLELPVPPGDLGIAVEKGGFVRWFRNLTLQDGDEQSLDVALVAER